MNGKSLCVVIVAAAVAAGGAWAQSGPKLYRWVDKDGKVHYDQALPPEAVNQARKEFNAETGSRAGEVERALTDAERAAIAAAQAAAELANKSAEEQRRQEEAMITTYSTEVDLRRAYGDRIALLKSTLESTEVSIRTVRENLSMLLSQASEAELAGRTVAEDRTAAIRELHTESIKQQSFQDNRRLELEALNSEFARMLARYRELKAAPAAPQPAASAAAPGGAR